MKIDNHIYKKWLEAASLDEEERGVVEGYTDEEVELYFNEKPFHFGTAGVRRRVGMGPQLWNKYTYRLLAVGYAGFIKECGFNKGVLVAHDNRPNGDKFAMAIAEVLRAQGIKVYLAPNNESIPTPIVSYWIKTLGLDGGVNVTASHNPIHDNGFKSYNKDGCQTNNEQEKIILKHCPAYSEIFNVKTECGCCCSSKPFEYLPADYVDQYFSAVEKALPKREFKTKDTKVLFSGHHGTSCGLMHKLAHKNGFVGFEEYAPECTTEFKLNEGESLNPEDVKSFNASQKYADEHGIKYQLAHDPDSDRNAVVEKQKDGSWYCFNGNEMAILAADYIVGSDTSAKDKYIVTTYVSGNFISKVCPKDVEVFVTKTGFKNIAPIVDRCQQQGKELLIAFEEAIGALICPINREKDAFQMSLLFLNMIGYYADQGKGLKDRLEELYTQHGCWVGKTEYFLSSDTNWKELFAKKIEKVLGHPKGDFKGYLIEHVHFNPDGDAVEFIMSDDNWIKFRLSGTEPKFKIYYNLYGRSKGSIMHEIDQLREYFKEYLDF